MRLPLDTEWSGCRLVYCAYTDTDTVHDLEFPINPDLWNRYISTIGGQPKYNVWYDPQDRILFGSDLNWQNSPPVISSFITRKELLETSFCKFNLAEKMEDFFDREPIFFDNFHHMKGEVFADFEIPHRQNVLVFSGGPSAREYIDRVDFDSYDSIVTCNHFFKSDLLTSSAREKIEYAVIGREIDLSPDNKEFYEYLENSNTKFLIEVVDDGNIESDANMIEHLKGEYPDRVGFFAPRYRSKIGTSPRLLVLASAMSPDSIGVIGMDGMARDTKRGDLHNHAFQKSKRYNQTSASYEIYKRNYVELWDYIKNTLSNNGKIKFTNLGEGHRCNQSTDITKTGMV